MYRKVLLLCVFFSSVTFAHGNILTLNLESMTPHSGQMLQVRIVDKYTGDEVIRKTEEAISSADFQMFFDGIEVGGSYLVDFYADHNGNGMYDDPPTDHTWRLELDDVQGDTSLTFVHNTNFTALDWQAAAVMTMESMTPHVGQFFQARLVNKRTMQELSRYSLQEIEAATFEFSLPGIQEGETYFVDFYADHNSNGMYDAPPTDHTWRMEFEADAADAGLSFIHNTDFTAIDWPYQLKIQFSSMTPHVGQGLHVRAIDRFTGKEIGRTIVDAIPQANFEVSVVGSEATGMYRLEFFADLNQNGLFDPAPADHTWSLDVEATAGDATTTFVHNTDFAALDWDYQLWLNLSNLTPHVNQLFEVRVVNQATGQEVGRTKLDQVYDPEVTFTIPGIKLNTDYNVDFYADHNGNGMYDAPATDHAWRLTYNAGDAGDGSLDWTHNTDFTDIEWAYNFVLDLQSMTPHVGQYFEARLIDTGTQEAVGTVSLDAIPAANFSICIGGIVPGNAYNIDYYADLNGNGSYDAPPTDHAWRDTFTAIASDDTVTFVHNTNFTDIDMGTAVANEPVEVVGEFQLFANYPNPFNPSTTIRFNLAEARDVRLTIHNMLGQRVATLVENQLNAGEHRIIWNGKNQNGEFVGSGIYFYRLEAGAFKDLKQMTLIK